MEDNINFSHHIRFLKHFLHVSPSALSELDSNRMTLLFFAISGIDILNGLDTISPEFKKEIVEWIYHLQVLPSTNSSSQICGFQGTDTIIVASSDRTYETAHLAMTYTALCSLVILGDDLSRVNKEAVIKGVQKLQRPVGNFHGTRDTESDMRFVYCAACICYILNDFKGIDLDKMTNYILDSIAYDGGMGQGPGLESHGGSTFCGVAALFLTCTNEALSHSQVERLRRWCLNRQQDGFQGRPNKPEDTCYSFWVGGTLAILDALSYTDAASNRSYVLSTQSLTRGGFAKWPGHQPDIHHTFFGLAGLSLQNEEGLAPLHPLLAITKRAHNFLKELHNRW